MRIAICNESNNFVSTLENALIDTFRQNNILNCEINLFETGWGLLNHLTKERCDIIFLNINKAEPSWLSVAKEIYQISGGDNLVFISSEEQLVYSTLAFRPMYFVRKSNLIEDLKSAIYVYLNNEFNKEIQINSLDGNVSVKIRNIIYLESRLHYVYINTEDETIKCRAKINDFMKNNYFVKTHKSYACNLKYIKKIHTNEVELSNGIRIPLSRSCKEECKRIINQQIY